MPPSALPSPSAKPGLHPRNRHRDRYDFAALCARAPDLVRFLRPSPHGDATIDYADPAALLALNRALAELETMDERMAKVVELRYFIGLDVPEVAATLGIVERTAQRDWVSAREWLRKRLADDA